MKNYLRTGIILLSTILLIGTFSLFKFGDRGFHFDRESQKSIAKTGIKYDYNLSNLKYLTKSVGYLRNQYIDPLRIEPKKMLVSSLKEVQKLITEVIVKEKKNEKSGTTLVSLQINDQVKTFDISSVKNLYEMNWKFFDIFDFLKNNLPSDIDPREVEWTAINGMLKLLDEHTIFLTPDAYREMKLDTQGKFGGLGIVITSRDGYITVVSVLEGTPAYHTKIKPKDKIVQIDDESSINMPLNEAVSKLRGKPKSKVTIWVLRKGWNEAKAFTITREIISVKSVTSEYLGKGIGYLKLINFQQDTDEEIRKHISKMEEGGKLKGLIIDLRNNPGGLLEQAVSVSDLFLKEGTIVVTQGGGNKMREERVASGDGIYNDIPLLTIINAGSASASEILAGALKNNNRSLIIGNKSFGKGTVQILNEIEDTALKLTIAQYLIPGDFSIHNVGVQPDISVNPVIVSEKLVNIYNLDEEGEEGRSQKNRKLYPVGKVKNEKPSEYIQYFLPSEESELEDEEKREKKEEETEESRYEQKFKKDFLVSLGEKILLSSPYNDRIKMMKNSSKVVEEIKNEEEIKIENELQKKNINWEKGKFVKDPQIETKWRVEGKKLPIQAGENMKIKLSIKNLGMQPLYKVICITNSENPLFDGREFIFGKIESQKEKSYELDIKIPEEHLTRIDIVNAKLYQDINFTKKLHPITLVIKGLSRPKFAYTYYIIDSSTNGNGMIEKGEEVILRFLIKNVGDGNAFKSVSSLKNLSGSGVFIKKGRQSYEKILKNEVVQSDFVVKIKKSYEKKEIEFELYIFDLKLKEFLSEKLRINLNEEHFDEFIPSQVYIKALQDGLKIFSGASDKSNILMVTDKGKIFKSLSKNKNWFKVKVTDEVEGFIKARDTEVLQIVAGEYKGENLGELIMRIPPDINLTEKEEEMLTTTDDNIRLHGRATFYSKNEGERKSVYIFRGEEKIYFETLLKNKIKDEYKISFDTKIPLEIGINPITIYAQEGRDHITSKTIFVLRQKNDEKDLKIGSK